MLFTLVLIFHVIVSLLLIAIILLQAGRGGLSESFGGGPTQSLFGTQTANFLTRTTAACAILFFATCMTLAVLSSMRSRSLLEQMKPSSLGDLTQGLPVPPVPSAPPSPAAPPATTAASPAPSTQSPPPETPKTP